MSAPKVFHRKMFWDIFPTFIWNIQTQFTVRKKKWVLNSNQKVLIGKIAKLFQIRKHFELSRDESCYKKNFWCFGNFTSFVRIKKTSKTYEFEFNLWGSFVAKVCWCSNVSAFCKVFAGLKTFKPYKTFIWPQNIWGFLCNECRPTVSMIHTNGFIVYWLQTMWHSTIHTNLNDVL